MICDALRAQLKLAESRCPMLTSVGEAISKVGPKQMWWTHYLMEQGGVEVNVLSESMMCIAVVLWREKAKSEAKIEEVQNETLEACCELVFWCRVRSRRVKVNE
jgi:hypothetical protein